MKFNLIHNSPCRFFPSYFYIKACLKNLNPEVGKTVILVNNQPYCILKHLYSDIEHLQYAKKILLGTGVKKESKTVPLSLNLW